MVGAPNTMKQPNTTVAPRRISIRPVSIPKPTPAMAITAIVVARVPSNVSCNHCAASTSEVEAPALENESVTLNLHRLARSAA